MTHLDLSARISSPARTRGWDRSDPSNGARRDPDRAGLPIRPAPPTSRVERGEERLRPCRPAPSPTRSMAPRAEWPEPR